MNVKFHKNCDYTGKILKISCVRCNFVKFDIHFLGSHRNSSLSLENVWDSWCMHRTGFSLAAFVSQSKSTELCSLAAFVRPQRKFTELCSSAAIVSQSKSIELCSLAAIMPQSKSTEM